MAASPKAVLSTASPKAENLYESAVEQRIRTVLEDISDGDFPLSPFKPPLSPSTDTERRVIYMVSPDHYGVHYVINPWMAGNVNRAKATAAQVQWAALEKELNKHATIKTMHGVSGVPDLVFTANAGLVYGTTAVVSHFRHPERQLEEPYFKKWFEENGYERVLEMPRGVHFEGAGDALFHRGDTPRLWMGYGFRTMLEAAVFLGEQLNVEVIPLRLIDERFYHLDTCFCPLGGGRVLFYPDAFDERSRAVIEGLVPPEARIVCPEKDALAFACNAVDCGGTIVMNECSEVLRGRLEGAGFKVSTTPMSEFLMAGGACKCLTLRCNEPLDTRPGTRHAPVVQLTVHFRGHLLDSGTLARVLDLIPSYGGACHVINFKPAANRTDVTEMSARLTAPSKRSMDVILEALLPFGLQLTPGEDGRAEANVCLEVVQQPGVAPDNFYITSSLPTEVRYDGRTVTVDRMRAECCIVVATVGDSVRARCVRLTELLVGQRVVVGMAGVHVAPRDVLTASLPLLSRAAARSYQVSHIVDALAWEMQRIVKRKGRIAWVCGREVVLSGGSAPFAALARGGFVHAMVCGTHMAVADLEASMYGTIHGIDVQRGVEVAGGTKHAMYAVNSIKRCGSIPAACARKQLSGGIFHTLVSAGIPYAIAGTIGDTHPLPDTLMDLHTAQREYERLLDGSAVVVVLSSRLHGGISNCIAGIGTHIVVVDLDAGIAKEVAARGLVVSSVVSDVGVFLNLLVAKLTL